MSAEVSLSIREKLRLSLIYVEKEKNIDFRLQIDYEEFDNTDDLGR
ncbi:hypothetical protein [Oceanivirga salmonicida]|nr:hypothetical protein [Oceanivirga salmonicida]